MATNLVSKFNRKFVVSAGARRYGSPHRLGNGRFGAVVQTESDLKKASSDSKLNLLGNNIEDVLHQQKKFYGTG